MSWSDQHVSQYPLRRRDGQRRTWRAVCSVLACATALFAAAVAASSVVSAQPPDAAAEQRSAIQSDPVFQAWKQHPGVQTCAPCHYESDNEFVERDTAFSRQNELSFWLAHDKHAIARRRVEPLTQDELYDEAQELLQRWADAGLEFDSVPSDWFGASNVLSRRICDKLGYDVTTAEGYATFRNRCLTCHGGYRGDQDTADFARGGTEQPGISCNYCHQLDDNNEWVSQHGSPTTKEAWRLLSPNEKAAAGMRDLVDSAHQANLCFDCHVGNRSTDQFVTHEMYAAGHPPLPSVELQTFCQQMPQHWRTLSQLYESIEDAETREKYFGINFPELFADSEGLSPGKVFWNTRKMLIGAVKAREQTLELILQSAHPDRWGDYALYDCAACHHELRRPSDRQQRGFPTAPGRPRQHEWPSALLNVAMETAGDSETARSLEDELTSAFGRQPFGDPADVEPAAARLRDQMTAATNRLQSRAVDEELARRVLMALAETPREEVFVYDAARQVVWAMQVVARELREEGAPLEEELERRITELGQPSAETGSTGIAATLPAGRQSFIYPANLRADLERRAAFDPDEFVARLREIRERLAASRGGG